MLLVYLDLVGTCHLSRYSIITFTGNEWKEVVKPAFSTQQIKFDQSVRFPRIGVSSVLQVGTYQDGKIRNLNESFLAEHREHKAYNSKKYTFYLYALLVHCQFVIAEKVHICISGI